MKRSELKNIIKPLVKECIAEALIEEGLLYTVVSEVAKGMSPVIMESAAPSQPQPQRHEPDTSMINEQRVQKQKEHKEPNIFTKADKINRLLNDILRN